jgi:hypothetical protein
MQARQPFGFESLKHRSLVPAVFRRDLWRKNGTDTQGFGLQSLMRPQYFADILQIQRVTGMGAYREAPVPCPFRSQESGLGVYFFSGRQPQRATVVTVIGFAAPGICSRGDERHIGVYKSRHDDLSCSIDLAGIARACEIFNPSGRANFSNHAITNEQGAIRDNTQFSHGRPATEPALPVQCQKLPGIPYQSPLFRGLRFRS